MDRSLIDRVIAGLDPDGEVVEAIELVGGVSADVLRVTYRDGTGAVRPVVLRRLGGATFKEHGRETVAVEHDVLAALAVRGFAVARPLHLHRDDAKSSPVLVLEWVEGSTDVAADELPRALGQMADFRARLHDVDPDELDVAGIERLEDPRIAIVAHLPDDAVGDAVRAVLAVGSVPAPGGPSAIVHGDFWPGNVLWSAGQLCAVIDWEDVRIGDPLADLACARVELRCAFGEHAQDDFTSRYLRARVDRGGAPAIDALPLWDAYVSATALSSMHLWGLDVADERARRSTTRAFFDEAVQALAAPGATLS